MRAAGVRAACRNVLWPDVDGYGHGAHGRLRFRQHDVPAPGQQRSRHHARSRLGRRRLQRRLRVLCTLPQLRRLNVERRKIEPRKEWQAQLESVGFSFHSLEGAYWDESACYRFSSSEIDMLEEATAELHRISLAAVQTIIDRGLFDRLAIERWLADYIVETWQAKAPRLYGRFDLRYDGMNSP